ncbi:hypothetical protein [Blastococcus aurantiacus]|nr:hypothetical protein [Blastococcus aurantiacus]
MTEPSRQRPVPGPPRQVPVADSPTTAASAAPASQADHDHADPAADRFADLEQRPVAEHVAVFEDEHGRLQRELGTIDQL